ncbi:MAG: insulinase family protein [Thermoleophilia bacterium]|nr:insulinase family protein [Thermoleophilia bacterium]
MTSVPQHYEESTVDGIRIVSERVPSARSVSVGVWIGVGSRHERDNERGWAHFVEHLLFKGNERIDATAISRFFDGIGSDANAATTKEYTVLHSRVLERHLPDTLGMFGEMVWHPSFDPGDVDSERDVILEEIAMYADSPSDVVHELGDELVYGEHPLALPIVGTVESISSAVASDIADFHKSRYVHDRIVISAAGAIDHQDLVALVRERFLAGVEPRESRMARAVDRPVARASHASGHAVQTDDSEQVHICLTWPGIARGDDRRFTLTVLGTLFGSTPGSRLFVEVRELRGLAYSVYSFQSSYVVGGQLGIYVGVRPERIGETLDVLAAELERLRNEPPTLDEVSRAQDHLEGRTVLSMESSTVRGNRLGAALVNEQPIESLDEALAKIRAVTPEDVQALARELFDPDKLSFAAVAEHPDDVVAAAVKAFGVDADAVAVREPQHGQGAPA